MYPNSTLKRFWNKVNVGSPDECWEWQGARKTDGYGTQKIKRVIYRAHRVSWTIAFGPIPHGICVLHSCDNPSCVNIKHLWLGSRADNNRDAARKGRIRNGGLKGEELKQSKLTETDVSEMRRLYATGKVSQAKLGKMFNVVQQTCWKVIHRRTWKHVP